MISTTYSSEATVPFAESDLVALLEYSRAANERRGLTGMLLYRGGHFIQVLEGPEDAVRDVLARITADDRHEDVVTLATETIQQRAFPEWTMGYRALSDDAMREVLGGDAVVPEAEHTLWHDSAQAKALLDWFSTH